jgi:hypothetical protein
MEILDRQVSILPSIDTHSLSISDSSSAIPGQPPRFFKQLTDQTVSAGSSAQLKCIVSGTPIPNMRWFVDGDAIASSE